jgi:hypothetical protein
MPHHKRRGDCVLDIGTVARSIIDVNAYARFGGIDLHVRAVCVSTLRCRNGGICVFLASSRPPESDQILRWLLEHRLAPKIPVSTIQNPPRVLRGLTLGSKHTRESNVHSNAVDTIQQLSAAAFCSAVALCLLHDRISQLFPGLLSAARQGPAHLILVSCASVVLHFFAVCHSVGLLLSRRRRPPTTGAHLCSRDQPTASSRSNKNIQNETQCDTPALHTQQHAWSNDAPLEPLLLSIASRLRRLTRDSSLSLVDNCVRALCFFRCLLARSSHSTRT